MSATKGINILNSLTAEADGDVDGISLKEIESAQRAALDSTSEMAMSFIRNNLEREWPPSGGAGDFPSMRTGSLRESITYTRVSENSRIIGVDPNFSYDRSKGKRLQRYSNYLQTGWTINTTDKRKYKDVGISGHTSKSKRRLGISVPGKVQPPRPFIENVINWGYDSDLKMHYASELRKRLPDHLKNLADNAKLLVEFRPPSY